MPGMIHDWRHVYWRNRDGSREFDDEEINPQSETLSIYENEAGERVAVEEAPEDVQLEGGRYIVTLNGDIVRNVEIPGFDEKVSEMVFGTRSEAREASAALRRVLPPIEEDKLEDIENYEELVELGKPRGYSRNDGRETIVEGLREFAL